jgi:hypothetical protein
MGRGRRRAAIIVGALTTAVALVAAGSAMAVPDDLKAGTISFQLKKSHGLKLKPKNLNLQITGGNYDPVDGAGSVEVSGGVKARLGKGKTKVKFLTIDFGANGAPGSITARIRGNKVKGFATTSGGTVTRNSWGAVFSGVTAKLGAKGAKALNSAFRGKKGKGKASAAKARGVKGGQSLGTLSGNTDPKTVAVVPGSGTMVLSTSTGLSGTLFSKLASHCIDPLAQPPLVSEPGVSPIAPATEAITLPTVTFTFPVTGGAVAPDFSDGKLITGGGQKVVKNSGPLTPGACAGSAPPTGTAVLSTEFETEFNLNALASNTTLPTGNVGLSALGNIDFSTGTRSIDPNTKQLVVTNATVTLDGLSAFVLNQVFPNQSGDPANDFAAGDLIGTVSMTATLR